MGLLISESNEKASPGPDMADFGGLAGPRAGQTQKFVISVSEAFSNCFVRLLYVTQECFRAVNRPSGPDFGRIGVGETPKSAGGPELVFSR